MIENGMPVFPTMMESNRNKKEDGVTASIDPGEIHTIASVTEKGDSCVITGRYMRSIHQLRNKKLKELKILMSRCKKGSRQWKKYNRAKRYVLSKSQSQLEMLCIKRRKSSLIGVYSMTRNTLY